MQLGSHRDLTAPIPVDVADARHRSTEAILVSLAEPLVNQAPIGTRVDARDSELWDAPLGVTDAEVRDPVPVHVVEGHHRLAEGHRELRRGYGQDLLSLDG